MVIEEKDGYAYIVALALDFHWLMLCFDLQQSTGNKVIQLSTPLDLLLEVVSSPCTHQLKSSLQVQGN
jgi:hypothetical protein